MGIVFSSNVAEEVPSSYLQVDFSLPPEVVFSNYDPKPSLQLPKGKKICSPLGTASKRINQRERKLGMITAQREAFHHSVVSAKISVG